MSLCGAWKCAYAGRMTERIDDGKSRCSWVNLNNPAYVAYHDSEWCVPTHDDHELFEMLVLEGFQAGLTWESILNRRQGFRDAFDNFDVNAVAAYDAQNMADLKNDARIIRNGAKIKAAVSNANVFRDIAAEYGSFSRYLWNWSDGEVVYEVGQSTSPLSEALSKDLKKRGMKFVGPTIMYSYLQAAGVINSHEPGCYLYKVQR